MINRIENFKYSFLKFTYCNLFLVIILFLAFNSLTFSQKIEDEFEEFNKEIEKEFNDELASNEEIFDYFIQKQNQKFINTIHTYDKIFVEYLNNKWDEIEIKKDTYEPEKKPDLQPEFKNVFLSDKKINIIDKKYDTKDILNPLIYSPVYPQQLFDTINLKFRFYGNMISIFYDSNLKYLKLDSINERTIALLWENTIKKDYSSLINQLSNIKEKLGLNDWGYYLLVKKTCANICNKYDQKIFLSWFILLKSGYKVKIGHDGSELVLLLSIKQKIYDKPYVQINDEIYYFFEDVLSKINSYNFNYPVELRKFDFSISKPLNFAVDTIKILKDFSYNDTVFKLNFILNNNIVDFYNDFPRVDINIYFNSFLSQNLKQSFLYSFKSILNNYDKNDQIKILMSFVQRSFIYKADNEQYGSERFFFPEQTLFYDTSDCEDRSILLSFLLREFEKDDIVGLDFPGHFCLGIATYENINFSFEYNGKKYLYCDPTYRNAPLGAIIPGYEKIIPNVINIESDYFEKVKINELWTQIFKGGAFRADNSKDIIIENKNIIYLTACFSDSLKLSEYSIREDQKNGAFLIKQDFSGKTHWFKLLSGPDPVYTYCLGKDKFDNLYLHGSFGKELIIDNYRLLSDYKKNTFIIKFDNNGNLIWTSYQPIPDTININNQFYTIIIDSIGEWKYFHLIDRKETTDNFSINFIDQNKILVQGNYPSVLGLGINQLEYLKEDDFNIVRSFYDFQENKFIYKNEYVTGIVFRFLNEIINYYDSIPGSMVMNKLVLWDRNNLFTNDTIENELQKIQYIKKQENVLSLRNRNHSSLLLNPLIFFDNSRFKINIFNDIMRFNILNGIRYSYMGQEYNLNYIALSIQNNNIIMDYDDHYQKKMIVRSEIAE